MDTTEIPFPGTYSLTVNNVIVRAQRGGGFAFFDTLDEARQAAQMICGATVIRWIRSDSGNGRTSEILHF